MKPTSSSHLAVGMALLDLAFAACSGNNCLRGLQNPNIISSAITFCASYTASLWTAPLPAYVSACSGSASKISSACSCVATSSPSASPSASPTPTSTNSTGPTSISSSTSSASSTHSASTSSITITAPSCPPAVAETVTIIQTISDVSTITPPASTITSTATITATVSATTTPLGSDNVPNPFFESRNPDWCDLSFQQPPGEICDITNSSTDGTFSGLYGPGMLKVLSGGNFMYGALEIPAVRAANPRGVDWAATAYFRAGNTTGDCVPVIRWFPVEGGVIYTYRGGVLSTNRWTWFAGPLKGSAAGSIRYQLQVGVDCSIANIGYEGYVDGVGVF